MKLFGFNITRDTPATEAIDVTGQFVDPRGAYEPDQYGTQWIRIGGDTDDAQKSGIVTESQLFDIQSLCRYFARRSPYCINGHTNRVSYIVGWGHTLTAVAKKDQTVSDQELAAVQECIDEFIEVNRWHCRQQECVRRMDRDGEVFLRYFSDDENNVLVRFVEPCQVHVPENTQAGPHETYGIRTKPDDVETVTDYCIDNQWVPADEIQHRKANVDSNIKRGIPLFWPVIDVLKECRAIRRNMAAGSAIQTSYAMVKTVAGGSANGPSTLRGNASDFTRTNPNSGKTDYLEEHKPGRIATKTDAVSYEFPFATTSYSAFVEVIQSNLREVASMLVMPEFMFTSDASNGNYASTMVAEGPAVRNFERLQYEHRMYDMEIYEKQIESWIAADKLPADICDRVEIDVQCPTLAVRDKKAEAEANQVLANNGILSKQTWSAEAGLDYAQEQENIDQHQEDHPDSMGPMPAYDPNQDPNADPAAGNDLPAGEGIEHDDASDILQEHLNDDQLSVLREFVELGAGICEGWVTLDNGVHVLIGKDGEITKGPKGVLGKNAEKKSKTLDSSSHVATSLSQKERNAIEDYTTDKFQKINGALRSGTDVPGESEIIKNLDAALDKAPKHTGTVFRTFTADESIVKQLQPGMVYSDKAYMSASKDVPSFVGKGKVAMQIISKNGVDISALSPHGQAEKEVLFQRGAKFDVIKAKTGKDGGHIVILREK